MAATRAERVIDGVGWVVSIGLALIAGILAVAALLGISETSDGYWSVVLLGVALPFAWYARLRSATAGTVVFLAAVGLAMVIG